MRAMQIERTKLFSKWVQSLRDKTTQARILDRVYRLSDGNFGDCKSVGDGVSELRLAFGPGYRIYYTLRGNVLVILLVGGDKSTQTKDIAKAKQLVKELR